MTLRIILTCSGRPHPSNGCPGEQSFSREVDDSHGALKDAYADMMKDAEAAGWQRNSKDLKLRCAECATVVESAPPTEISGIAWEKWAEAIRRFCNGEPASSWGGKNGLPTAAQWNNARNRYPQISEPIRASEHYKPRDPRAAPVGDDRWAAALTRFEGGEDPHDICTGEDGWPTRKQWNSRMESRADFRDRVNREWKHRRDAAYAVVDHAIELYEQGQHNVLDLLDNAGRQRWWKRTQEDPAFKARVDAAHAVRKAALVEERDPPYQTALDFIALGGEITKLPVDGSVTSSGLRRRVGLDPEFAVRYDAAVQRGLHFWRMRSRNRDKGMADKYAARHEAYKIDVLTLDWQAVLDDVERGGSIRAALSPNVAGRPNIGQWNYRRRMDTNFAAAADAAVESRDAIRAKEAKKLKGVPEALGTQLKRSLNSNDLYAAVNAAVSVGLPRHIRDDVISSMVLAVLEGEIAIDDAKGKAREFTARYHRAADTYRLKSYDNNIGDTDLKLIDTFSNEDGMFYQHEDDDDDDFE